ncbi:MAG: CbiX/SirB N-terminal domain-containing protein [Caldimonas sp.]
MKAGLILFAHGARDPRWAEPFVAIAERIRRADPGRLVQLAFLEMMMPDLQGAADRLAAAGATRIDVVPLFLGTGGHLRKDLPPLVDTVRSAHPQLDIRLHQAIGENAVVIEAIAAAALAMSGFSE